MGLEISCLLVNFASCLQRMGAFCCHAWCALMCYHPTTTVLLTSHGQSGIFITCCSMVPVTNSGQRRLFWSGPNIEPSPTSMLLFELAALPLPKVSWSNEPQKRKKVLSPHLHLLQFVLQTKLFLSWRQTTNYGIYLLGTLWSKLRYKWCKASILQFAGTASDKPRLALSTTRVAKRQT